MAADMVDQKEQELQAPAKQEDTSADDGNLDVDMYIKHPLQNKWTLWFFKNDRTKDWEENQREVTTFDTVEDFWALYNHIKAASEISTGCDYSLFKEGIKPMWEDPRNKKGGRWLISLDKKQRTSDLDNFWLEVILCLIGESFDEDSDNICGAVVNIRNKGDKISVWTGNADNRDSILKIGHKLKERLGIPPRVTIVFEAHRDTMNKSGSSAKHQFTI